jgi:hypothetical protein
MNHDHMHHQPDAPSFWRSRAFLVFLGFAGIALPHLTPHAFLRSC